MNISDGLKKAAVEAAKARDQVKLDTVRMASSAIHYREIEKRSPLEEAEGMSVISTLCKQRKEAMEQFEKGGRADLVAKEKRELEILLSFLPPQLSRDEIAAKARQVIEAVGAKSRQDMGKVIKVLMKELAGKADGAMVSSVIGELLK